MKTAIFLLAAALSLGGRGVVAAEMPQKPLRPVIASDWWRICETPDLGELRGPDAKKQQIVDHGFIRAANGRWQLWACIRGTGVGRLLYAWEGESLERGPWPPRGVAARASAEAGEKVQPQETIQAPFFLRDGQRYLCFYNSAGVRLMTSDDGVRYQRRPQAEGGPLLYADGGRDVMVLKLGDVYYAYSTVSTTDGRGYIILRTSRDLREWTRAKIVCEGGRAGGGPVSAESPFVAQRGGWFYLFRASSVDGKTYVYRSERPDDFGPGGDTKLIAELPIKAPEIIIDGEREYISDLADFRGIKVARLSWEEDSSQ